MPQRNVLSVSSAHASFFTPIPSSNPYLMKRITLLLSLMMYCMLAPVALTAQEVDGPYVIVEYMKVKPGMEAQYRACEAIWKRIHTARKEAGLITDWSLEQIHFPGGSHTEYDYLTVTHFKDWTAVGNVSTTWDEATWQKLTAGLSEDELELAMKADDFRTLVKREIWSGIRMVTDESGKPARFIVENYMHVPTATWDDWVNMEIETFMPVHAQSAEMGHRAGWVMAYMAAPRGAELPYNASTLDMYHEWADMHNDESGAWEAVHPDMDDSDLMERVESARTIVRSEVREVVDAIE